MLLKARRLDPEVFYGGESGKIFISEAKDRFEMLLLSSSASGLFLTKIRDNELLENILRSSEENRLEYLGQHVHGISQIPKIIKIRRDKFQLFECDSLRMNLAVSMICEISLTIHRQYEH